MGTPVAHGDFEEIGGGPGSGIWVVVKIMVPFWVPYILGAVF